MKRIFVVEDEQSIAEMLKLNLELEGFDVSMSHNGREAFNQAANSNLFDLIILDVMLPEVSGLDICREIRKFSDTPILFLSAKGTTTDRVAGLKLGADDYLSKPFDLEELLLRVQNLIGRQNPEEEFHEILIGESKVNFETFTVFSAISNTEIVISKREIDLLRFFYTKQGLVVSRDEILDVVWGKDVYPTSRTIDNYILAFRKIFESDVKNPIHFHSIRGVGYKMIV